MTKLVDESEIFNTLKPVLMEHASRVNVVSDSEVSCHLDTCFAMKNKKPLFFGAAQIKKTM